MRKLFPRASCDELKEAFPSLRYEQILGKAKHLKLRRGCPPYQLTAHRLMDELRDRCRVLGYTMADLDEMAGTGRYFRRANWRKFDDEKICRAVRAIGGAVEAIWPD